MKRSEMEATIKREVGLYTSCSPRDAEWLSKHILSLVLNLGMLPPTSTIHDDRDYYDVNECGDVLWYMAVILEEIGSSFEEVMAMNIEKLEARYPNGFTEQAAKDRKDVPK